MDNIKPSLIISTYNWHMALDIILNAILTEINYYKHRLEIIIADDGSDNKTASIIKQYQSLYQNIKHIWHEDKGFRKAEILNKAIDVSTGNYLIFLDGDCIPCENFILNHIKLAEIGYFVAGKRVLLSEEFTNKCINNNQFAQKIFHYNIFKLFYLFITKNINKFFIYYNFSSKAFWRYWSNRDYMYPKGCNFAAWKNDIILIDKFDAQFIGWGHEDTDLFIKLIAKGVKIKNGIFAIPVLHLWHKQASRLDAKENLLKIKQLAQQLIK